MTHLGERITDFFFGELSAAEMDEARRHLADCAECRKEVQQFEHTHAMLKSSSDAEPPRHIVFETEKRSFGWRWLAPIGMAAALVLAVWIAAPMQIQWNASQLVINFGKVSTPVPAQATVLPAPAPQPVVQAVVQPIDYDRIIKAVQAQIAVDLKNRDLQQVKMNQRTQDYLDYLRSLQETAEIQTFKNTDTIQMIALKTGSQD